MAYSTLNLNQKFELRGYTVFFDINDSIIAENILDCLDRATSKFMSVFGLNEEPKVTFYLMNSHTDVEAAIGIQAKVGKAAHIDFATNTICLMQNNISGASAGEIAVRELGYLYFDKNVGEREIRMRQLRTPSWLREGLALQSEYIVRQDQLEFLQKGWEVLQEAKKNNQLIKPAMMLKDINLIPDPNRRQLACFEAYYMVKMLITNNCDGFFAKYSTLMKALEDMEAEVCFRQITSFDIDRFYTMFETWVNQANAWVAME